MYAVMESSLECCSYPPTEPISRFGDGGVTEHPVAELLLLWGPSLLRLSGKFDTRRVTRVKNPCTVACLFGSRRSIGSSASSIAPRLRSSFSEIFPTSHGGTWLGSASFCSVYKSQHPLCIVHCTLL